ncbi:MAG TPA: DUF1801 domain-containing protein [Candidatus Dormibacteraeota bacterium]|jgi:hypothetical protein|nr:DUF1801 domain-containing protein [Candidatus Dormibacteraeota bacterium]
MATPQQQLRSFLAKYDKHVAATAQRTLGKLRKLVPGSIEMVYDNYNALVIGFGPTEKASEAILSIALYPRYVTLFFLQGASLPDPHKRLAGSGNIAKQVRLESEKTLDDPQILELINVAMHRAKVPLNPKATRKLVIKSISAKQRPRKPGAK